MTTSASARSSWVCAVVPRQLGLPGDLAEKVLRLLIRSSLTTQEQVSVASHGAGSGRRALVIGGAGKMGAWFSQFLLSQGFAVQVADPAGAAPSIPVVADWRTLPDLGQLRLHRRGNPTGCERRHPQ